MTGLNENLEITSKHRLETYATAIFKRNMKQRGVSLPASMILERVSWMIVQRLKDKDHVFLVRPGWRTEMEKVAEVKDA